MKKYTKKRLNLITRYIESNFSEIIDFIIYYDSINEDLKAWDLIYMIEDFGHEKEIELLLSDFESRDLKKGPTLLYNALLYGLVNYDESKDTLIKVLNQGAYSQFKEHLRTLDEKEGRDGDLNVEDVFKQLNENSNV